MFARGSWFVVVLAGVFALGEGLGSAAVGAEGDAPPTPVPRHGERAVTEALGKPVSLTLTETPLAHVADVLESQCRIHVRLDRRAMDDVGIDGDTPLTFSIADVPLCDVLDLMLSDLDLTWTIRSGVLTITTPERAEEELITRTYEVADLVFPIRDRPYDPQLPSTRGQADAWKTWGHPLFGGGAMGMGGEAGGAIPRGTGFFNIGGGGISGHDYVVPRPAQDADFDSLIDLITATVKPTTWDQVGGPGSIGPFGTSLVISQTLDVHREVEQLLDQLRARQRELPAVVIDARWLLLDAEELDGLLGGAAGGTIVDEKRLDELSRTAPAIRGRIACLSGQWVHVVSGDRRSQVASAIPVIGSGVGYQPVIVIPNVGALLEVRPVVERGRRGVLLDVESTVTRWGEPPPPVQVGGVSPAAEMPVPGNERETAHLPPGAAGTMVDRPNLPAQQLAARMRVPAGRPVLVGGMTLDPTAEDDDAPNRSRKQLYLFLRASIAERSSGRALEAK